MRKDKLQNELGDLKVPHFLQDRVDAGRKTAVSRRSVINRINHVHFVEGEVEAHIIDVDSGEEFVEKVLPGPFIQGRCEIALRDDNLDLSGRYKAVGLIIDDGKTMVFAPVETERQTQKMFAVMLSSEAFVFGKRQNRRYHSENVMAEIWHADFNGHGVLEDFSPSGMRIRLDMDRHATLTCLQKDLPIRIKLTSDEHMIFAGECMYVRSVSSEGSKAIVVHPINAVESYRRIERAFKRKRKNRNPRLKLKPAPRIVFEHPFTGKTVKCDLADIATSGFAFYEKAEDACLFPGMVIPELEIIFASRLRVSCSTQVLYAETKKNGMMRYGLTITDMDVHSYSRLFDVLSTADDRYGNMNDMIDMDALWEFFFDSGFIYPEKYEIISDYRNDFKKLYQNLYLEHDCREVFVHYTYQNNGRIYGHISMVRGYPRLWMIHHLAARPMNGKRVGLRVLDQGFNFIDGLYRLPSVKMDYMMFYYRPTNAFTDYFFGDFHKFVNNGDACSVDLFAYNSFDLDSGVEPAADCEISESTDEDLRTACDFYRRASGGLFFDALNIINDLPGEEPLADLYGRYGLTRQSRHYSIKRDGHLVALAIVDQSDFGVNLSEFLNSMKVIVIDQERLSCELLRAAVSRLGRVYGVDRIPVMIYPSEYLESKGLQIDRYYNLWILNSKFGDEFIEYTKQRARLRAGRIVARHFLGKVGWRKNAK